MDFKVILSSRENYLNPKHRQMEIEGPLLRFQTKLVFFAKPAAACRIEGTFQSPEHSRRTAVVVFHGEESHTLCELSWNIRISITGICGWRKVPPYLAVIELLVSPMVKLSYQRCQPLVIQVDGVGY